MSGMPFGLRGLQHPSVSGCEANGSVDTVANGVEWYPSERRLRGEAIPVHVQSSDCGRVTVEDQPEGGNESVPRGWILSAIQ